MGPTNGLKKWVLWPEIGDNLRQLLEEGVETLESWSEKDLKPASPIERNSD
jgi:hypothetical protein